MDHLICRVEKFEIVAPYMLRIDFDDHTHQVVDFEPVLYGELYGPLRDLALFNQVTLDSAVHTLVWPNGADFDPATLHEWPRCGNAFAEMARSWDRQLEDDIAAGRLDVLAEEALRDLDAGRSQEL